METYKSQTKIIKYTFESVPKDVIEKRVMMQFFNELPLDKLKKIINFKEIDFENKKLWGDSREDKYLYELLSILRKENVVQYECSITI